MSILEEIDNGILEKKNIYIIANNILFQGTPFMQFIVFVDSE